MLSFTTFSRLLGTAVLATAGLALPIAVSAQPMPDYAQQQPGYAQDETITGRIAGIDDTWHVTIADDRGFNDTVELHQGTIINPTGLTLAPGMSVTIDGYANGPVFEANEIDTPYTYSGPLPVPVYYGSGWWYPGYPYGYGPSFSLWFNFGHVYSRPFVHTSPFFGFRAGAYGRGYVAPLDTRFGAPQNTRTTYSNRNVTTNRTTVNNYNTTRNVQNYTPRNTAPRNTNSGGQRPTYSRPANNGNHNSNTNHQSHDGNRDH